MRAAAVGAVVGAVVGAALLHATPDSTPARPGVVRHRRSVTLPRPASAGVVSAAAAAAAAVPAHVQRPKTARFRPLQPSEWGEGCDGNGTSAAAADPQHSDGRIRVRFSGHDFEASPLTATTFADLTAAVGGHPRAHGREVERLWYRTRGWRCGSAVIPPAKVTLRAANFADALPSLRSSGLGVSLVPMCRVSPHTELWGDVVTPGDKVKTDTAAACCDRCRGSPGGECNVWVWCGEKEECEKRSQYRQCWLKRQPDPRKPRVMAEGPAIPWTSGAFFEDP
eukprot:TRINITY_DN4147_c0_g1_i1.p1 TRINITY_DN4147_c0_g1~~TRINITY_DN4147_c0_g1_i1.p1  ORF type:complete len:292 (+),score=86.84 TRINITY_DN4147_c0_g1_i1:35-877(+)